MGGVNRNHHHHHHHRHHSISSFNPACCLRPFTMIKFDVDDNISSSSSFSNYSMPLYPNRPSASGDPTSPRIGCMGQIKGSKCHHRLHSFKRMLSRRGASCSRVGDHRIAMCVSVADMDPPLPVVSGGPREANPVSLWGRRFGGKELESLQIQPQDYKEVGVLRTLG